MFIRLSPLQLVLSSTFEASESEPLGQLGPCIGLPDGNGTFLGEISDTVPSADVFIISVVVHVKETADSNGTVKSDASDSSSP